MNDPHIWWYVTRASAIVAWVLMTLSVVWGILLSTRIMRRIDNPSWLLAVHSYLGGTSIVMVLVHMTSLMLDGWLRMSPAEVLVPFVTDYRPLSVALGIVSFYLLVAVQLTSLVMKRLPRAFWKGVHYASYAVLLLIAWHAGFTGTDAADTWFKLVAIALIGIAAVALFLRIVARRTPRIAPRRPEASVVPTPAPTPPLEVVGTRRIEPDTISVVVADMRWAADGVLAIRFIDLHGADLPPWQPGAHITLHLPTGADKHYSLAGHPGDRRHYDIAVLRTTESSGGSRWMHDELAPGDVLSISGPQNHFALEPAADHLFVAGGIGITPILSMIASLPPGHEWLLLYFGRSRSRMAFLPELLELYPGRVLVRVSDERFDDIPLADIVRATSGLIYCCGPESLMQSVAALAPANQLRLERFVPLEREPVLPRTVRVSCSRSGTIFSVAPEQTLLEALQNNGMPVIGSCRKGVCGTCEVRVTEGVPEHLDSVMDDARKVSLGIMYPCVSRSASSELVLDL